MYYDKMDDQLPGRTDRPRAVSADWTERDPLARARTPQRQLGPPRVGQRRRPVERPPAADPRAVRAAHDGSVLLSRLRTDGEVAEGPRVSKAQAGRSLHPPSARPGRYRHVMATYRTTFPFAASPDRVWEVISDFDSWPESNPSVPSIKGDLKVGNVCAVKLVMPHRPLVDVKVTLTDVDPGRRFAWHGEHRPRPVLRRPTAHSTSSRRPTAPSWSLTPRRSQGCSFPCSRPSWARPPSRLTTMI